MQTIECWDVAVWDGGDRHNHKFYVASEEEAKKWKEKNKYDFIQKRTFVIFDTVEEAEDNDLATVRKRLLSKLTTIEKRALGIYE